MKTVKSDIVIKNLTTNKDISPAAKKIASQKPTVINPVLSYTISRNLGRGLFIGSEYNLAEIGRVADTESMVRQSFDKKIALMFKEGFDFIGKNPLTVTYIKNRLTQVAQASQIPTLDLMRSIGASLMQKSNSFLLKVRNEKASGGKIRTTANGKELKPIAAYFPIPAETMEFGPSNNKIVQWRQRMPDGTYKPYSIQDIIHFYSNKKDGFVFGTPLLTPVIDDIRALRKIEENIELLIYQHLFPLFQFQIGTPEEPAGLTEEGDREIDVMQQAIQYMPSEGGIVTSHRHKISAIGIEGRALRAENYLEHFKRRVIAGLGISSVDLGEADSSNRSTAENMSRNLIDSVKDFQQVFEIFFNEHVINELLLESNFNFDVLDDDNKVVLKFREIDISTQIKKEAHYADQFNKDIITHDEARLACGRDPIRVPTQQDIRGDADLEAQYPEWYKTRWKLFKEPELLIVATDEIYSVNTAAAVQNPKTEINQGQVEEASNKQLALAKAQQKEKAQKTKDIKTYDQFLTQQFNNLQVGLITYIKEKQSVDYPLISQIIRASMTPTIKHLVAAQVSAFKEGYYTHYQSKALMKVAKQARTHLRERAEKIINKLVDNLLSALDKSCNNNFQEAGIKINLLFDSFKYRITYIETTEIRKAYLYGKAKALYDSNPDKNIVVSITDLNCSKCSCYSKQILKDSNIILENLPPFHPNCVCDVKYE